MKKGLLVCLILLMLLSAAGCGSESERKSRSDEKTEKARIETDYLKIVVGELATGEDSPGVKISIENTGDFDTRVKAYNITVNGKKMSTYFECFVRARERVTDVIRFSETELREKDIDEIREVSLVFAATKPEPMNREYAGARENTEFRALEAPGQSFGRLHAEAVRTIHEKFSDADPVGKTVTFKYSGVLYAISKEGADFYTISKNGGDIIGAEYKDILSPSDGKTELSYEFQFNCLKAYSSGQTSFLADRKTFTIGADGGVLHGDEEIAFISRYEINAAREDVFLSQAFKQALIQKLEQTDTGAGESTFKFTEEDGAVSECTLEYRPATMEWIIYKATPTEVFDFTSRVITITY